MLIYTFLYLADVPAMAEIGFSQSDYTALEGGADISVCIILVSLMGQVTGGAFVGINTVTIRGSLLEFSVSGFVNFTGVEVNEPILCGTPTVIDDNILAGPQQSDLSAFIEGPAFITFAPGRDSASITVIDNDGMYN